MIKVQIDSQGKVYTSNGKALLVQEGSIPTIESLSITPTTSSQTITATSGIDGYSPISVSAVTSSIDQNIISENIKKDVQILGVTGIYEGSDSINEGILIESNGSSNSNFILKSVGITSVSAYQYMFNKFYIFGSTIDEIDLSSIESISGEQAFAYSFQLLDSVIVVTIGANSITGSHAFHYSFKSCKAITDIYFPNLRTNSFGTLKNQFESMLASTGNTTTHTLHFPSNLESTISGLTGYPLFGGTSGYVVCAFDLDPTE